MPPKIANRAPVLATHAVNFRSTHSASAPNPYIDTQRSLFAHPHAESQPTTQISDEIKTQIAERLKDCLEGNKPMVSFHSPRGYQKCRSLCDQTIPAPDQDPQRPSLLQYCLQAQARSQDLQITIDEKKYTLKFESLVFEDGGQSATSPVKHIKGQLLLNPENPSEQVKMIRFVEMAPPFDGYALSANDLIKCADQMALIRQDKQNDGEFNGQFSSANGICRSASLLIVDQFNEFLSKNNLPDNFNVADKVKSLVDELRKGRQGLIPHHDQINALNEACTRLFKQKQQNKSRQEEVVNPAKNGDKESSTPFAASLPVNDVKDPIPDLWIVQDDGVFDNTSDCSSDLGAEYDVEERKPAAVINFGRSEETNITFNESFWGWNQTQEQLEGFKGNLLGDTVEERAKKMRELRSAIQWLKNNFLKTETDSPKILPDWLDMAKLKAFVYLLGRCSDASEDVDYKVEIETESSNIAFKFPPIFYAQKK